MAFSCVKIGYTQNEGLSSTFVFNTNIVINENYFTKFTIIILVITKAEFLVPIGSFKKGPFTCTLLLNNN